MRAAALLCLTTHLAACAADPPGGPGDAGRPDPADSGAPDAPTREAGAVDGDEPEVGAEAGAADAEAGAERRALDVDPVDAEPTDLGGPPCLRVSAAVVDPAGVRLGVVPLGSSYAAAAFVVNDCPSGQSFAFRAFLYQLSRPGQGPRTGTVDPGVTRSLALPPLSELLLGRSATVAADQAGPGALRVTTLLEPQLTDRLSFQVQ